LKNDGLTAIKIDEENELIDFVEEIWYSSFNK
jgi:hypothetical protein